MLTRQLLKTDLPKNGAGIYSLRIPVLLNNEKRFVCDKHFGDDTLCYLEDNNGVPVKIESLQVIIDGRNAK